MQNETDLFLNSLMRLSQELSGAIESVDMDKVGVILSQKQKIIEDYGKKHCKAALDDSQKDVLKRIIEIDKANELAAQKWKSELAEKIKMSQKLGTGLVGYIKSNRNYSSGQLMDKKR